MYRDEKPQTDCQVFYNHSAGDHWCFRHDDHADLCSPQVFFGDEAA